MTNQMTNQPINWATKSLTNRKWPNQSTAQSSDLPMNWPISYLYSSQFCICYPIHAVFTICEDVRLCPLVTRTTALSGDRWNVHQTTQIQLKPRCVTVSVTRRHPCAVTKTISQTCKMRQIIDTPNWRRCHCEIRNATILYSQRSVVACGG
jgi:hypothetical protein